MHHLMQECEQREVIGRRALPAGWPSSRCCTLFTSRIPSARMISSSVLWQPHSSLSRRTTLIKSIKVEFEKNLSFARPLHVLVLGVVHQTIGEAGKIGGQLQQAERQDALVSRAGGDEIWNLWAGRGHLVVFLSDVNH